MQTKEIRAQTIKCPEHELANAKTHKLILSKVVEVFDNDYGSKARKRSSTVSSGSPKNTGG